MNNLDGQSLMRQTIKSSAKDFLTLVEGAQNIVMVGHLNPDGDCIGSLVGLRQYINSRYSGKNISVIVPNAYQPILSFLDKKNDIINYATSQSEADELIKNCNLLICLDFPKLSRTDRMEDALRSADAPKVLIDHHLQPEQSFQLMFSETNISSASELTYWLLRECNSGEQLSQDVLEPLCVGLITDTNNFANSLFPSTFLMASQILESGVEIDKIQERVLNGYTEKRMRLMGEVLLNNMKIYKDLHAAAMVLDLQTQKKFNYRSGDSEGFVNLPLKIADIAISVLFTEEENGEFLRVSLRSKGDISVNELSRLYFNGGGHKNAAGGKLFSSVANAREYFAQSVEKFIKENGISFE